MPPELSAEGWDSALAALASPPPLLQSWAWGEVQARAGWRTERVLLPGDAMATVLLRGRGPLARAYVPRGPVPPTAAAVESVVVWARERGLSALRVEPEGGPELGAELRSRGFEPTAALNPEHTLVVRLASDEEMLASFKSKHRYNIRLAQRRGVEVVEGKDAAELHRQVAATETRKRIRLGQERHFRNVLELLPDCLTYVAASEGRPLSAILVARHAGRAYYLYGGGSGDADLKPSYAVQWAAMRAAARAGCADYDLWGVPPSADPGHPWFGLWQFKTGFGGDMLALSGAWDLVLSSSWSGVGELGAAARRGIRKLRS